MSESKYKNYTTSKFIRLNDNDENGNGNGKTLQRKSSMLNVIRVPFRNVARITVSLPLGGFVFCVFWALWTDVEQATYTHCGVRNYLPSLSAAMGGFELSQTVWRICIALHAAPRFLVAGMYYGYLKAILYKKFLRWVRLAVILNVLENLGLIGLTYVSSKDNYDVHEKCFVIFVLSSELYMLLLCGLLYGTRNIPPTHLEARSLQVKWSLVILNLFSFSLAAYAFVRHNSYCEEGMYTIFAMFEYVVVLTNMGFHMTAFWDFYDKDLTIGPHGLKLR